MNKPFLQIICGLLMFIVFILFKINVSYLLCFIGLIFMIVGVQRYPDYKNKISTLLSVALSFVGLTLIYVQYKLDYIVMGLFLLILVVLLFSNLSYPRKVGS